MRINAQARNAVQAIAKGRCRLMHFKARFCFITVDYFNIFFEIDWLDSTNSSAVIQFLWNHFVRHGISEAIIFDNKPQFSSVKLKISRESGIFWTERTVCITAKAIEKQKLHKMKPHNSWRNEASLNRIYIYIFATSGTKSHTLLWNENPGFIR